MSFFMFAKTRLNVTSQHHIDINCNSLYTNCRFLKTDLVDHIGVLQTPTIISGTEILFVVYLKHDLLFESFGINAKIPFNRELFVVSLSSSVLVVCGKSSWPQVLL